MKQFFEIFICILPLVLAFGFIFLLRKNTKISAFMKSVIKAMIGGIIFLSMSISLHHFSNISTDQNSNWSVGFLPILQIVLSGIVFAINLYLKRR